MKFMVFFIFYIKKIKGFSVVSAEHNIFWGIEC